MSRPLIRRRGLDPNSVKVVLLNDPEINAFVAHRPDRLCPVRPASRRPTTSTRCRASSPTSSAMSPAAMRSAAPARARAGDRDHDRVAGARRSGDRRGRRRCRHGHHDGRPAGGDGRVPRLHPRPGSHRRPGRAHPALEAGHQRQGPARLLRQAAEPGIPARGLRQGQLRPHPPAVVERIQALEQMLKGDPGLEQADRPGARSAVPAGQGQAARLRRTRARRCSNIRRATRAFRRIMPAPTPIISAAIRTKRKPRPMRCSRPIRTIPSSSS